MSEGGLVVALAECCYSTFHRAAIGADVQVPSHLELVKDLFGEAMTRVILSTTDALELRKRAGQMGLNFYDLGRVGGKWLILHYEGERIVDLGLDELESTWRQGLAKLLS